MEINKILTLSTAHVTPQTLDRLERNAKRPADDLYGLTVYSKDDYGYFIYINRDELAFATLPADLNLVVEAALGVGCSVICLDRDGDILPELPEYDWSSVVPDNKPVNADYITRLLKAAKEISWRYVEINTLYQTGSFILTHIALPDDLIKITVRPDNFLGDVRQYAANFNRDEYFGMRYQQELEESSQMPNAQKLLDEAKSAQFAVRGLVTTLEGVSEDPSAKKLEMRVGMSIMATDEEFKTINSQTREGKLLLQDKIFSAAFRLSGECYSEDNADNHDPDEWKHAEISYQF